MEHKNVSGTGTLHIEWNVRPAGQEREPPSTPTKQSDGNRRKPNGCLPADPAIINSMTVIGHGGGATEITQPSIPPPCACFRQRIKLFDLCRCQIAVATESKDEEKANNVDTLGTSASAVPAIPGELNRLPKLVVSFAFPPPLSFKNTLVIWAVSVIIMFIFVTKPKHVNQLREKMAPICTRETNLMTR